ncbi:hypothetical protein JYT26_01760 [Beggiatoa alba]|nr:hypothetical protein [Beggiatoa alba]
MTKLKGNAIATILFTFLISAPTAALEFGWNELPDTRLRAVCPPNTAEYSFANRCGNVINAWSGAVLDTLRNRLLIWGGGHGDYYGNEVYSLNLSNFIFERLTNPSSGFIIGGECADSLPDGNPTSRHTYGGLAYIAHADKMFAYGGSRACGSGGFGTDVWTLNLSTNTWTKMAATGRNPGPSVVASQYDPVTKKVYVRSQYYFYAYDYDSDSWERLSASQYIGGYGKASAVIDPVRRKFVIVGPGGVEIIDLNPGSDYSAVHLNTTGPQTIISDGRSPGLAYDKSRDKIVAWDGSDSGTTPDTVYVLDIDNATWLSVADANRGPVGNSKSRGTFGRWRYVEQFDAFIVVNSADENAFLFSFEAGSLPTPDTVSPAKIEPFGVN